MTSDLADSIGILDEPGGLETVLLNAGAIPLLAEVQSAAERMALSPGAFASLAVRRFIERASDDDWATLTSGANRQTEALGSVVAMILHRAVRDASEVFP